MRTCEKDCEPFADERVLEAAITLDTLGEIPIICAEDSDYKAIKEWMHEIPTD